MKLQDLRSSIKMHSVRKVSINHFLANLTTTALESAKLWIIDRRVFQTIMMRTGMMRQAEHIAFLKRHEKSDDIKIPRYLKQVTLFIQ